MEDDDEEDGSRKTTWMKKLGGTFHVNVSKTRTE
jgi:hypothetical protein